MKFTKEEISLCKQVAKKHRKPIEYGDWFIMPSDPHLFPTILEASPTHKPWKSEINKKAIPLWTISDCLEFLREKGWLCLNLQQYSDDWQVKIRKSIRTTPRWNEKVGTGKTPLEALLKAVLAVLEEE